MAFWRNPFRVFGKKRHFIAVEAGITAVRSVLIEKTSDGVFGFRRQIHHLPEDAGEKRAARIVGEYINDIILRYVKTAGGVPERLHIGVTPEFGKVTVETFKQEYGNKKHRISRREIEEVTAKNLAEPIQLTADGYDIPLSSAEKIAGSTIELSVAELHLDDNFAEVFSEIPRKWNGIKTEIRSTPVTVASFIVAHSWAKDFLLAEIGGSASHIALVQDGSLKWIENIPIGGREATREIMNSLNMPFGQAEDLKRHFGTMELPESVSSRVEQVLKLHAKNVTSAAAGTLLAREAVLPPMIFLYGGGARIKFIQEAFGSRRLFEEVAYAEKQQVEIVNAERLTEGMFANVPLRGPEHTGLASLALDLLKNVAYNK